MPETNYPYGHGDEHNRPGGELPAYEPGSNGHGGAPF